MPISVLSLCFFAFEIAFIRSVPVLLLLSSCAPSPGQPLTILCSPSTAMLQHQHDGERTLREDTIGQNSSWVLPRNLPLGFTRAQGGCPSTLSEAPKSLSAGFTQDMRGILGKSGRRDLGENPFTRQPSKDRGDRLIARPAINLYRVIEQLVWLLATVAEHPGDQNKAPHRQEARA